MKRIARSMASALAAMAVLYGSATAVQAYTFDGSGGVSLGNGTGNFGTSDFSITLTLQTDYQGDQAVFVKRSYDSQHILQLALYGSGAPVVEVRDDGPNPCCGYAFVGDGTQKLNDGSPHQLSLIRHGVDIVLSIDGAAASGTTYVPWGNGTPFTLDLSSGAYEALDFVLGGYPQYPGLNFRGEINDFQVTATVNPAWECSSGGTGISYNADPPDPQGLQAALDLPTDVSGDANVWEQAGAWTYWNWGGCGGGVGLGFHFKGTFTLTAADLAAITSAKLIDPLVTPGRLPVNDRLVTWVNGTFVGSVVPDRLWDAPTVPYTIGWHGPAQSIPVSYLHEGVNTIDVVGAELCGDGGMGKLALSLELNGTPPPPPPPVVYHIATSAGPNGSISASADVNEHSGFTVTVTPNVGYHIADVLVDRSSVGAVASYSFVDVTANHTVSASFAADNHAPDVSAAAPSIASIWPPNHKMVPITINGVTDPDGDAVTITITGITNNETGAADASGIGTSTAQVAATRNGKGTGRTYTISFTATDGKGGSTSGSVTVVVPHNGPHGELADNDQGDDHGDKGKVEKKDDDKGKKDDDKGKKTVAKAPAKRAKPTAVENATWGEVKNSEQ